MKESQLLLKHLLGILTLREQDVREHLTGGFLRDVSHKSSVPYQFLATGMSGTARRAPRTEVIG